MELTKPKEKISESELNAAKKKMGKCMFSLYRMFPFWACLLEKCELRVVRDDDMPTACITKNAIIRINYDFMADLGSVMLQFVLAHEVMHCLLTHFERQQGRNGKLWNMAGDVQINHMLQTHFQSVAGVRLNLEKFVTAESVSRVFGVPHMNPDELTTEKIYDLLQSHVKDPGGNPDGKDGPTLGSDMADGDGSGDTESEILRPRSEDAPKTKEEWTQAGLSAATRAKIAGQCPAFMEREIDALLNPKLPWRDLLAQHLRQKFCQRGSGKHTFTPPNRRYLYKDIILTSRVGTKKPVLAFCVDTSGSMAPEDLTTAISEMDCIRKLYKVPIYLIESDYSVAKASWIQPYEEIPKLIGGGGTSFIPAIKHIRDAQVDVDLMVYFTDGYGDFGQEPDFEVLWVMTTEEKAPFGSVVRIS